MNKFEPTHYLISTGEVRPHALAIVLDWNPKDAEPGMVEVRAKVPGAPYGLVDGLAHRSLLIPLDDSNEAHKGFLDAPTGV